MANKNFGDVKQGDRVYTIDPHNKLIKEILVLEVVRSQINIGTRNILGLMSKHTNATAASRYLEEYGQDALDEVSESKLQITGLPTKSNFAVIVVKSFGGMPVPLFTEFDTLVDWLNGRGKIKAPTGTN